MHVQQSLQIVTHFFCFLSEFGMRFLRLHVVFVVDCFANVSVFVVFLHQGEWAWSRMGVVV